MALMFLAKLALVITSELLANLRIKRAEPFNLALPLDVNGIFPDKTF